MLSYARVEKNSVTLRPERISVLALATSVIARISPRLAASGMDSQLFIAPELQSESVMADMTAVEQIVYNLADNAAKYARFDGSILKLKLTREKRFLVIRVEDGGKGISESLRRKRPENSLAWGWAWPCPVNWPEAWEENCGWKKVPETEAALPSSCRLSGINCQSPFRDGTPGRASASLMMRKAVLVQTGSFNQRLE